MRELKSFAGRELKTNPRQVQIFTPLPSTYSSLMYFTEIDPATGRNIFVEKKTETKRYCCGKNDQIILNYFSFLDYYFHLQTNDFEKS
jgi:hypothetical protein